MQCNHAEYCAQSVEVANQLLLYVHLFLFNAYNTVRSYKT